MTDVIERLTAALAGRYTIERKLGQGGMATVYLAHDLKHQRRVAIKVLRPELAAVLGAERFVQEIKTTASLQHPHILPLFDSGQARVPPLHVMERGTGGEDRSMERGTGGEDQSTERGKGGEDQSTERRTRGDDRGGDTFLYYVMPYIEGETVRDKLNRETQFGIEEAVRIAAEVADALDYAHRHGVIHRDIKPENLLLHDGRPMVMDFGIALAVSAAAGGRMTETGLSLGTPHYMSPEQATADRDITGRSDIYSLASVLYEMLTGEPPHMGTSAQQIIMKIIAEPVKPVRDLRKSTPEHVAAAVAQALEKLPADRFASAAEFGAALRDPAFAAPKAAVTAGRAARSLNHSLAVPVLAATTILFAAFAVWALATRAPRAGDREPVEFAYRAGSGKAEEMHLAISADGRRILQAIEDSTGVQRIFIRELGSTALVPVPGTEGAQEPEFSPDGSWIVFTKQRALHKVPAGGGPSTMLADSISGTAASWGSGGVIVYSKAEGGLWRVGESGGITEQLTTLDPERREWQHWYPQILPGGRAAIFNNFSTPMARSRIEVVEFATGRRSILVEGALSARYVATGHLLFVRDGAIFAAPFELGGLRVTGAAVPVVQDVAWSPTDGAAAYAVSPNGTLVYLRASEWNVDSRVVWVDRAGNERPALPEAGTWAEPRLSPDGRWIAVTRLQPTAQIWVYDLRRQVLAQLTRTEGISFNALWMPDSRSIIHTSETPVYDLHRLRIDGGQVDTLVVSPQDKMASSVSPDGRTLAYVEVAHRDQLMATPIAGGTPGPIGNDQAPQRNAAFSPDGRWMAYEELGSTEWNVYVRDLNGGDVRRQVSAAGGSQPRWTKGGRELIYRAGNAVFAVPFQPATGEVGSPSLLFWKPDAGRYRERTVGYDVTPDGSRLLLVTPVDRPSGQPTVVVLNWLETLKRIVPR